MNNRENDQETGPSTETDGLETMIRMAGPRGGSAEYGLDGVREEALLRWEGVVRKRRRRKAGVRVAGLLALAASLAVVGIGLGRFQGPASLERLGTVERVRSGLTREAPAGDSPLGPGDAVLAGLRLKTGPDAGAALQLNNGIAVRLDQDTRLSFRSATRLRLEEGSVFIDTEGAGRAFLEVETSLGVVRDIGTAFQVGVSAHGPVRVLVREGRIEVRRGLARHEVPAGKQLTISAGGEVEIAPGAVFGSEWAWILQSAPEFQLEEATLGAFVDWFGRETGRHIRFEGTDAEAARGIVLHGSLADVPVEETAALVLAGSGLGYRFEGGQLVVTADVFKTAN